MAKYFLFIWCFSEILTGHIHNTQSIFTAGPPRTIPTKLCYNIGSNVESVGPFQAEPSDLVFLRFTPPTAIVQKNIVGTPFKRAFAVQRTAYREMSLYVTGEPDSKYQYTVELGFIDSKACPYGGTEMTAVAGDNKVSKTKINPYKSKGCNVPHKVTLYGATPDAWNRIIVTISGPSQVSLSTVCFKMNTSKLKRYSGMLHLAGDDFADLYINGKFFLHAWGCGKINKTKVTFKRGDVIAVSVRNTGGAGGVRVAFILDGRSDVFFGTQTKDWKVRPKFASENGAFAWTTQSYVDNDWPLAVMSWGCYTKGFPDVESIWTDKSEGENINFLRYTFRP